MSHIKGKLITIGIVFAGLFAVGRWNAVSQGLEVFATVFKSFFPAFFDIAKSSLKDYLTSPYFIVGIIISIASGFGIWFGAKGGKVLFLIVSIICELVSLVSILSNVL